MPQPKVELTGPSGYKADVTSGNRLKVEADLSVIGDVNIGNVDVHLDGGVPLLGNAGAVAAGVLRVTLASDDPAVVDLAAMEVLLGTIDSDTDAIKTAVQLLDNAVDGSYLNVNMNLAGSDAQAGEGTITATTQRVTIATDDDGVAHLSTIASGQLANNHNVVVTSAPTTAVTGTFWQTTQPVSGTVTANLSSTDNTVLDNILTKNTEIDAVLDTIKVDTEAIETAV